MRRRTEISYGETTILSLQNITAGSRVQIIAYVKIIDQSNITVTDGLEDLEIEIEGEELPNLRVGETIIAFGEKTDSGIEIDHIQKLNLDWYLYQKMWEFESRGY
ncbi:MAG: hypothetical protein JSV04_03645 [Candidatus Heimdallarchaeota archaeon]|nr:MAG: hypothetical protein JSV04_03645 [Candidatus Heimdallarchaeota archaeon]